MSERQATTSDLARSFDAQSDVEDSGVAKATDAGTSEDLAAARADSATVDGDAPDDRRSLLPDDQTERFTVRWQEIQASFVDRPRESVEQADTLVADLMRGLAAGFSEERGRLESQWDRGDDVSTEDLRVALMRYRSFFDRLLAA